MPGFLDWYNRELDALRSRSADFARRHPKIAARLRLTGEAVDDPHVERIVQSFAYTAARIRQKLDDDFPELTDTLLEALYPQYLAQIPSMSIMRLEPARDADEVIVVPRGTQVDTEAVRGDRCRYVSTQDVALAPLRIVRAALERPPFAAPPLPGHNARGCLSITVEATGAAASLADLSLDRLSFFVNAQFSTAAGLFEAVVNGTRAIAAAEHAGADHVVRLAPREHLKPGGFGDDEAMLPFPLNGFPGFRLLTEFFALPEKFLFFSVDGLAPAFARAGSSLTLWFYLDAAPDALVRAVGRDTFDLHCTPVVNLFPQRAEPIRVDRTRHEYELMPDARRNRSREVHSVRSVTLSDQNGARSAVMPFFGRKPATRENRAERFWQHKRIAGEDEASFTSRLAFVDLGLDAASPDDGAVLSVDTLCINRGLPEALPFGGGQPFLTPLDLADRIGRASLLLPPSATTRFDRGEGSHWRLVSHLSLNHMPLTAGDPDLLRDILRLYDFREAQETSALIEAVVGVSSKRATTRLSDGSIVNGIDITLELDDTLVDRGTAFLFGTVLSRFLGLYASINTFSRLTVKLSGIVVPVARFEPRSAHEVLL